MLKHRASSRQARLRVRTRRQQRKIRSIIIWVLFTSSVLGGLWFMLNQPGWRLNSISVESGPTIHPERIRLALESFYAQPHLFVPHDSIINPSFTDASEHLLQTFSDLSAVEFRRTTLRDVEVSVQEHQHIDTLEQDGVYFKLNQEGYVFGTTDQIQGRLYSTRWHIELRSYLYESDILNGISELVSGLHTLGIEVDRIHISNKLETIFELRNGAKVLIRTQGPYEGYIETLREIVRYKEFSYDFAQGVFGREVDYINLRYGDRILYCYQGDECDGNYDF